MEDEDDRLLCFCLRVPYGVVDAAIRDGNLRTVDEVTRACKAGGGCRSCHPEIEDRIAEARGKAPKAPGLFSRLKGLFKGGS